MTIFHICNIEMSGLQKDKRQSLTITLISVGLSTVLKRMHMLKLLWNV